MKINPTAFRLSAFALSFSLFSVGEVGAAPQPRLDPHEAEQIRSLAYGVSQGNSLIIRSRQVERVLSSGAGTSSPYGFAEEGGMMRGILWLRFQNAGSESWSTQAIEFTPNFDASRYNSVVIWVRALQSNQRFLITMQDRGWKDKKNPQVFSSYFPLWGLPEGKILQVVIPFKALTRNASIDYARLSRLGFQFGRQTAGNTEGNVAEIIGVSFVDQPENPKRIILVDLNGHVEKLPSVQMKEVAPVPTPYPKPAFTKAQIAKAQAKPKSKKGVINFVTDPTYFEATSFGVTAYRDPTDDSQPIGTLEEGKAYLGLRSQKMDDEIWFLVDIDARTSGWVPSKEVNFASRPN
jgi:hypothetical protein